MQSDDSVFGDSNKFGSEELKATIISLLVLTPILILVAWAIKYKSRKTHVSIKYDPRIYENFYKAHTSIKHDPRNYEDIYNPVYGKYDIAATSTLSAYETNNFSNVTKQNISLNDKKNIIKNRVVPKLNNTLYRKKDIELGRSLLFDIFYINYYKNGLVSKDSFDNAFIPTLIDEYRRKDDIYKLISYKNLYTYDDTNDT